MIPILYDRNKTPSEMKTINNIGYGYLADAINAVVTEERNGMYELEIEYPINGINFEYINYGSWIKAKPNVDDDAQLFRVYKISKPINNISTIYAEHVSYLLSFSLVKAFNPIPHERMTCPDVFEELNDHNDQQFPFEPFATNVTSSTNATIYFDTTRSVRDWLMGQKDSILTMFPDGEYKFDNFSVCYCTGEGTGSRGRENGITIEYGANLSELRQDVSDEPIINTVYPYWPGGTGEGQWANVDRAYYPGQNPHSAYIRNLTAWQNFGFYYRVIPLSMKDDDRWKTTVPVYNEAEGIDDFQTFADEYFHDHPDVLRPEKNLDISFVDLSTTMEYKDLLRLEKVGLCDFVTVKYPAFGINEVLKVVKTEYDVLNERYKLISLGSLRKTL